MMEFELIVKNNTEVAVRCIDVNKYSVETVRTIVVGWAEVKVFALGNIKIQKPLL